MSKQETIDRLNQNKPGFIQMLGGRVAAINPVEQTCTMDFDVGVQFCHSIDVVQGGFITAMLDAAMSHAAFGIDDSITNVSSLEIKTTYLEPTRAGCVRAVGTIVRSGYKLIFLEGHLYDEKGLLTATASSVAKLVREGSAARA